MGTMIVELDDSTRDRLTRLVNRTGKSVSALVNEAVLTKLDEYDDYFRALAARDDFHLSGGSAIDLTDVEWPLA